MRRAVVKAVEGQVGGFVRQGQGGIVVVLDPEARLTGGARPSFSKGRATARLAAFRALMASAVLMNACASGRLAVSVMVASATWSAVLR